MRTRIGALLKWSYERLLIPEREEPGATAPQAVSTRADGCGRDGTTPTRVEPTRESKSEADLLVEDGVRPRERFMQLLRAGGGWVRQKEIVETTNLSKATVSRTLSTMEESGVITRRRVGRENIVYLAGREPSNAARAMHPEYDDTRSSS